MRNQFNYKLRYLVLPDTNVKEHCKQLVQFCRRHHVEEVILFIAPEEWNNGLLSHQEEDIWYRHITTVTHILRKHGIDVSLNLWMTVLHCDRGRKFPEDYPFRPLVSPLGEKSKACASFADPVWQKYISRLYSRFAELKFRILWIEDDFRYHNHNPLTWGGGFEPEVIQRFEKKIGRTTNRDEIVKNILKPGTPHPWRAIWMETWREIQLEVATMITQAVLEKGKKKIKLGLMSSHPSHHAIEGRDWQQLLSALSINRQVAHRPHFTPYMEQCGKEKPYAIMMLDLQKNFQPSSCEVTPEIENFPYTTWNKSDTQTWSEMALCMFYGSDNMLLNLFPMTGTSLTYQEKIGNLLDRSRASLTWIQNKFSKSLSTTGIGFLWKQNAPEYIHTHTGKYMDELYIDPMESGFYLMPFGVPCSARIQKVNAIFGSNIWSFTDDEVMQLLQNGLLLDGLSARILCERGFSKFLGVQFRGTVAREESVYSIELITGVESTGLNRGFPFNINKAPQIYLFDLHKPAQEWTTITDPTMKRIAPGIIAYTNELGGRVIIYAVANPAFLPRNNHRQILVHRMVSFLANGEFYAALVTGGPYLLPIHFKSSTQEYIVILNGSTDPAKPMITLNRDNYTTLNSTLLKPLSKPQKIAALVKPKKNGLTITTNQDVPYYGFWVVELIR
ncbi:MAG: hypothetical protein N3A72_04230 [bacterium]|nr:hypothetical protein [bacterium]